MSETYEYFKPVTVENDCVVFIPDGVVVSDGIKKLAEQKLKEIEKKNKMT